MELARERLIQDIGELIRRIDEIRSKTYDLEVVRRTSNHFLSAKTTEDLQCLKAGLEIMYEEAIASEKTKER